MALADNTSDILSAKRPAFTFVAKASFITCDFNDLIYSAPASLQLLPVLDEKWSKWQNTASILDSKIISSPYNDAKHLLDLHSLCLEDRILALALTTVRPINPNYATLDLDVGLNVSEVNDMIQRLCASLNLTWKSKSYYLVIFRSKMKPSYDNNRLFDLDKYSHGEAIESGGLLKYWFGTVNSDGNNLAFCIWRNRQDARNGGRGPWHALARKEARHFYESINFSTYTLNIDDGAASWQLEPWVENNEHQAPTK